MRTFRALGIVGSAAALLLSSSVVFAQTPTTGAAPAPGAVAPPPVSSPTTAVPGNAVLPPAATTPLPPTKVVAPRTAVPPLTTSLPKAIPLAPVSPSALAQPRAMPAGAINTAKGTSQERAQATTSERMKAAIEARREEAKVLMETKREEAKTKMEAQREKAAKRLADIQDKVKKEMAERIAGQFENLNKTWTDHFMQLLDRYDEVVQKMQDRAAVAAAAGKDVTAVTTSLQSTETVIETARAAVIAQAAKIYALDPSTIPATATTTASGQGRIMQNLRSSFQKLHDALFKDLFALRDGPMADARKAVQDALQTLSRVPNVDDDNAVSTGSAASQ